MNASQPDKLIAVDVGNSRMKWGLFVDGQLVDTTPLPLADAAAYNQQAEVWQPALATSDRDRAPRTGYSVLSTDDSPDSASLAQPAQRNRCDEPAPPSWAVASVNPDGSQGLLNWLRDRGFSALVVLDNPAMLPLRVELKQPEAVGIDRLLNAVAVNERRPAGRPAVIVDCGSAITVDAVSGDGAFLGGAIAAGLSLSSRGLHEFTYWLPLLTVSAAPDPLGKSTADAMKSGLFWGTVGAVRELVRRIAATLDAPPAVTITGGDAALVAPHLDGPIELVPELTLHGIYLATQHVLRTR